MKETWSIFRLHEKAEVKSSEWQFKEVLEHGPFTKEEALEKCSELNKALLWLKDSRKPQLYYIRQTH